MSSTAYFVPEAPFRWTNSTPEFSVMSVNATGGAAGAADDATIPEGVKVVKID